MIVLENKTGTAYNLVKNRFRRYFKSFKHKGVIEDDSFCK